MSTKVAIKQTAKAGKKVGKALSTFEKAANSLEVASAEHLSAAETLRTQAEDKNSAVQFEFETAMQTAFSKYMAGLGEVSVLHDLAESTEVEAENAQIQADNLRTLLAVV